MEEGNTLYRERYRPQFHFTSREGWLNDPNGLVYSGGEYHLFFQHNPAGTEWGNMTWGHALSTDLVHWRQLPHAIQPYGGGTIFSGSAVIEERHAEGARLVAFFTHAKEPYGQAAACSTDNGRTWSLCNAGKPVVPNQGQDPTERDPKVFRHEPSGKWVMVLSVKRGVARIFNSDDLQTWHVTSDVHLPGFYECPDLFELRVDGDAMNRQWVLHDAGFNYWLGSFDGRTFTPSAGPFLGDFGDHFYAAQTWNNTGNRVLQIAWMRGGQYPGMPFNQQMTFPCELTLRTLPQGVRLCRTPAQEIEALYAERFLIDSRIVRPGENPLRAISGALLDIEAVVEIDHSHGFSLECTGQAVSYGGGLLTCLGKSAGLTPVDGAVHLRMLVDRTSLEVFGNHGAISMSLCFLPQTAETELAFNAQGGPVHVRHMAVRRLRSVWKEATGGGQPAPAL